MSVAHRTCPLCEAMCGLDIEVDGERIVAARGDAEDVFSKGYVCPKGASIGEVHHDPDRLERPMRRAGSGFVDVSWDEALGTAAERIRAIRAKYGPRSVALYQGNPTIHNLGATLGGNLLGRALRTQSRYSASSVDQLPKQVSSWLLFGHQILFPIPDVDRTDLLVIIGADPIESNGSLMSAPGIRARMRAIRERGGKVVVIDPRRSRTAKLADEHLFVRPGTDAWVLAALARTLLGDRADPLDPTLPTRNAESLRRLLAPFTPEVAEKRSGVPAEAVVRLAGALASTPRAAVYGRVGTCTQAWGTLCSWLVDVVNLLSGHLDREGGVMFPEPPVDLSASDSLFGPGSRGRWASAVRGLPEVMGELPIATLAEDILTDGEDRVRALITLAGNPVLSSPNGPRLAEALDRLEFMVSIDPWLNETTKHAHVVLPPASALTRGHYDIALGHTAVRNVARWSPPVVPAAAGSKGDWDILVDLAARLAKGRVPWGRRLTVEAARVLGEDRVLDLLLRSGPYGWRHAERLSLRKLKQHPHGIDLGPLRPSLARRMRVDAIDLAPALITEEFARLGSEASGPDEARPYVLIGRRDLRSNNSWMHNAPTLVKGPARCTLQVHPADAARQGLVDGGRARVESAAGAVVAAVEVTDDVMEGVVSLPHGWGHGQPGTRLSVANAHPGVNANAVTDPMRLDRPSGTAALNGVPVSVSAVEGA